MENGKPKTVRGQHRTLPIAVKSPAKSIINGVYTFVNKFVSIMHFNCTYNYFTTEETIPAANGYAPSSDGSRNSKGGAASTAQQGIVKSILKCSSIPAITYFEFYSTTDAKCEEC